MSQISHLFSDVWGGSGPSAVPLAPSFCVTEEAIFHLYLLQVCPWFKGLELLGLLWKSSWLYPQCYKYLLTFPPMPFISVVFGLYLEDVN